MSNIRIYFSGVFSANQVLRRAIREISELEREFELLQKRVDPKIQSRYQIAEKLSAIRRSAEAAREQAKNLLSVTDEGLRLYQETEIRLCRSVPRYEGQDER